MIELAQARDLLKRAMETQGRDFRYRVADDDTACSYKVTGKRHPEDDRPCTKTECLIGVALRLAGETRHLDPRFGDIRISAIHFRAPDMLSNDAASYFGIAQRMQDQGHTWGEAYDTAEQWAERMYPTAASDPVDQGGESDGEQGTNPTVG